VGPKVVSLYVVKFGRGLKSVVLPIQPTQPAGNSNEAVSKEKYMGIESKKNLQIDVRIAITNRPHVALEMADINRVEAYLTTN